MQVYLVGGAVRDQLLGRPVGERDWVVVGGTPEELQAAGYRAVGREFPVFLHPETQEEYALARLERKVAPGYHGFVTEFSPAVTLEQDLQRRDLTINAMARDDQGRLIDPYGGVADIEHRWLRHVSAAFAEDPVRILRVARFAARFAPLGFRIAPETEQLMRGMVADGEVAALVPERVWRELERALGEPQPEEFFCVLERCGALSVVLPEIAALLGDTGQATRAFTALRTLAAAHAPTTVRWAALLVALPEAALDALCERLRVPTEYRELALLALRLRLRMHGDGRDPAREVHDPEWLLSMLEAADAFRRPERFRLWLQVLQSRALAAGVPGAQAAALSSQLHDAQETALAVKLDAASLIDMKGPAVAGLLRERRLAALRVLPAPP